MTSFYLLTPVEAQPIATVGAGSSITVGIAVFPVDIPAYLDRPQIVTRTGSNTLQFAEFNKWAEPLGPALRNLLVDDLAQRIPSATVFAQPSRKLLSYNYGIEVRIRRFEGVSENQAVLQADWAIYRAESGSVLARRTSSLTATIEGHTNSALVASMSRLVGDLASDIAGAVNQIGISDSGAR